MYQSNLVIFDVVNHAIRSQCDMHNSGAFFISTEENENAGLVIDKGEIVGAHFNSYSGDEALSSIGKINRARFFFRPGKSALSQLEVRHDLPPTPDILNHFKPGIVEEIPLPEVPASRQRVLVIDDSRMVRKVVNKMLTPKNYEILEAEDGEQGVISVESERPDLVLLDIVLPGIDGNEVLRQIRSTEFGKNLPVILLTSTESLIEQGSQANGRLGKPFKSDQLLQCINDVDS